MRMDFRFDCIPTNATHSLGILFGICISDQNTFSSSLSPFFRFENFRSATVNCMRVATCALCVRSMHTIEIQFHCLMSRLIAAIKLMICDHWSSERIVDDDYYRSLEMATVYVIDIETGSEQIAPGVQCMRLAVFAKSKVVWMAVSRSVLLKCGTKCHQTVERMEEKVLKRDGAWMGTMKSGVGMPHSQFIDNFKHKENRENEPFQANDMLSWNIDRSLREAQSATTGDA